MNEDGNGIEFHYIPILSKHWDFYSVPMFRQPSISTFVETLGFLFRPDVSTTRCSDKIYILSKHWDVAISFLFSC